MRFALGLILFICTAGLTVHYTIKFIKDRKAGNWRTKNGARAYWMFVTTIWYINVWQALTGSMAASSAPGQDFTNGIVQIASVAIFAIALYTSAFVIRLIFKAIMRGSRGVHRKMANDGVVDYNERELDEMGQGSHSGYYSKDLHEFK